MILGIIIVVKMAARTLCDWSVDNRGLGQRLKARQDHTTVAVTEYAYSNDQLYAQMSTQAVTFEGLR
jgi:hypothetical protein